MDTHQSVVPMLAVGFACLICAAAVALQFYRARQQRLMFEAALAGGQTDLARDLLRRNWLQTALRVLTVVFVAFVLLVAVVAARGLRASPSASSVAESAGSQQTVERVIGAPLGTVEVTINGHKAHGCLTGDGLGVQSCGSPYQDQLRFSTIEPGRLNVYYIPDTDQYYVYGPARVTPAGKIVHNGLISTREALGGPAETPAK